MSYVQAVWRKRLWFSLWVLLLMPFWAIPVSAAANGITSPADGAVISRTVAIRGVANDPAFAKWQLDLLVNGDEQRAVFLAMGRTALPVAAQLLSLDTQKYPDGSHRLRLRVVRRDGNYDESFTAVTIDNSKTPRPVIADNGLYAPKAGAVVKGTVGVDGAAHHPQFSEWQVHLLVGGNERQAVLLGRGRTPVLSIGRLVNLNTTNYPDGNHQLRLRVVQGGIRYDEYFLPITVDNSKTPPLQIVENGIRTPADGATVKGTLNIRGAAHDPRFAKWQLDLLLYGDERQRVFLQVGTSQLLVESALASLNTTRYPNGTHGLRLRVVRKDGNYDEYVVRMVIAN